MEGPGGGARMFTGVVRRLYEVHFRKEYVRRQLESRRGECRQCGTCCRFLFRCPMLTPAGRCLVYGKARPLACRMFPIDGKDIGDVAAKGGACGYRFGGDGGNRG
ncbi:MAG: hypothetical protein ACOZEN_07415 [Thermodesulfobacteriota bacterium]